MSKVVALDIDGCLADFTTSHANNLIKLNGSDPLPEGWRNDPNWPQNWDWDSLAFPPLVVEAAYRLFHETGNKFWETLSPVDNAQWVLSQLNKEVKKGDLDLYFLTHRMGHRAKLQTEKWLYEHGVDYPTVITGSNKIPFLRTVEASFFIDDKPDTISKVEKVSREEKWPNFRLFIKDAPYNRTVYQVERARTVQEALTVAEIL